LFAAELATQEVFCVNSGLWEPIQEHIDKLNSISPLSVHHYTILKSALGVLKSGQMWFTEREFE
jgi:hypothetical protein